MLALAWPTHVHHEPAHQWFSSRRHLGWATCALTQSAFVRLSIQPSVVKVAIPMAEAIRTLESSITVPEHRFWPMESGMLHLLPEIRERLIGHQQVTDALLLDLAILRGGKLATFDRRIEALLGRESPHRNALEIIAIE